MNKHTNLKDVNIRNEKSLVTIIRAIKLSRQEFSIIFIQCNYSSLRQKIMDELKRIRDLEIIEIFLSSNTDRLYEAIKQSIQNRDPSVVIVFGLESVNDVNKVLKSLQQERELYKKLSFPIVLWLNNSILLKLVRLAPDFRSWASTPINFEINN